MLLLYLVFGTVVCYMHLLYVHTEDIICLRPDALSHAKRSCDINNATMALLYRVWGVGGGGVQYTS